jgi:glucose-1-phosphatase
LFRASLVKTLRTEYRVGCLSNTNAIHWKRLTELADQFHFSFPSHITGFMKPDHRAYSHVVRTLGVQPSEIYFFDDLPLNVVAAKEIGLNAFLVGSPQEVESILQAHRLLPPVDRAKRNEFAR